MGISSPEFSNGKTPTSFHFSRSYFHRNLIVALALTLLVCAIVYLFLAIIPVRNIALYVGLSGLVFFAFFSAKTTFQYFNNEAILLITPTGVIDRRISGESILWETVKEVVLHQRESEFFLAVYCWPKNGAMVSILTSEKNKGLTGISSLPPDHIIDLTPLEISLERLIETMKQYCRIRTEN